MTQINYTKGGFISKEKFNGAFKLILKKIKELDSNEKDFKIGKYIFNSVHCGITINSRNRYIDETSVPSNVLILVLDVKGFHDDDITRLTILRDPDIGFIIQLDPERDFLEVMDFLMEMPD